MSIENKKFSKAKWLESANAQIAQGTLSERERDDALEIWVNDLDGKTMAEITKHNGGNTLNPDWFVD